MLCGSLVPSPPLHVVLASLPLFSALLSVGSLPRLSTGSTVAWSQSQTLSFWMEQCVLSCYSSCCFPLVLSVSGHLRLNLLQRIPSQVK